jgi:fibronectin-binding autotransporter adhesin
VSGQDVIVSGGAVVTQSGGTLTNDGSMLFNGATLSQSGGTVADGNVTLENVTFNDAVGTGTFLLQCDNTLGGTIAKLQSLTVQGNSTCGSASTTLAGNVTNDGTLSIQSYSADTSTGIDDTTEDGTLTNDGTLQTLVGSPGVNNYLELDVTNPSAGKISLAANLDYNASFAFTNSGSLTVSAGAELDVSGGAVFVQKAGKLTNSGSLVINSATLTQSGGTVADGNVTMQYATFHDTVGSGSFVLQCDNTVSGTIPSGQNLTVESNSCGGADTTLTGSVINKGTLGLESLNADNPAYITDSSSSGRITNDGTIVALAGAPGANVIEVNVTNTALGTIDVTDGADLSVSGFKLTESASSTLEVTVDATANEAYGIVGGTLSLGGILDVNTVGSPATGSQYAVVSGSSDSGTFSNIDSGSQSYTVSYASGGVTLTAS